MPNTIQLLFLPASALLRATKFKQPDDDLYCIRYLRYLRDQPLQVFDVPHDHVTSFLVSALAVQVELKSDDVTEDIKEMVILCRELLNSDISACPPTVPFNALGRAINIKCCITGEPRDQVIECLQETNIRLPYSHGAAAILDRTIASTPHDLRSPLHESALREIALLAYFRFFKFRNPQYLEEAISHYHTYLSSASLNDPLRPDLSRGLAAIMNARARP
jgi:hypothetical protein